MLEMMCTSILEYLSFSGTASTLLTSFKCFIHGLTIYYHSLYSECDDRSRSVSHLNKNEFNFLNV